MILYRYFRPTEMDFFEKNIIRFSPPLCFNDPFELKPLIADFPDDVLHSRIAKEEFILRGEQYQKFSVKEIEVIFENRKRQLREMWKKISEEEALAAKTDFYADAETGLCILCLTERHDNLLMWAHYTECHKGFVVGFESDRSDFKKMGGLCKVIYTKERTYLDEGNVNNNDFMYTKSSDWEYEKEWRIIGDVRDFTEKAEAPGQWFTSFPRESIVTIYFGCKSTPALIERAKQWRANRNLNIEFKKAEVHTNRFELAFETI